MLVMTGCAERYYVGGTGIYELSPTGHVRIREYGDRFWKTIDADDDFIAGLKKSVSYSSADDAVSERRRQQKELRDLRRDSSPPTPSPEPSDQSDTGGTKRTENLAEENRGD